MDVLSKPGVDRTRLIVVFVMTADIGIVVVGLHCTYLGLCTVLFILISTPVNWNISNFSLDSGNANMIENITTDWGNKQPKQMKGKTWNKHWGRHMEQQFIFTIPCKCTRDKKLRALQFKILHYILPTNVSSSAQNNKIHQIVPSAR
jgi:hypothetical protein